ncbi:MAG: recombinase family protein [Alphaproteobacteria bacterium]|nr:recombinase family protein [Alphaproteobacteria bacterium]
MSRNRRRPGSTTPAKKAELARQAVTRRRAVLYARVSSTEQHVEGFSIEAQQELLRKYADGADIEIVQEFVDVETAKKAGRQAFGEMLEFFRTSDVRLLLVEKTDRLYRNISDWVTLDALDVEIHLVKEGGVLSDDSKSHEKFIHGIKVLMAKNYIDNLSEEVSKGLTQKARQGGWPGRAPLGYRNVRSEMGKNVLEVDAQRGPVIAELFRRYAEGADSIMDLVRFANEKGLRTERGNPVSRATLHYMLQNPLYMGRFSWNGEWYDGRHQPLVTAALFEAVQDQLDARSRTSGRKKNKVFTFSGLLQCGTCHEEGIVRTLSGEMKKGQYVYYACPRCRIEKRAKYWNEHDVERMLLKQLDRLHMPPAVMELVADALRYISRDIMAESERDRERLQARETSVRKQLRTAYDDRLRGRLQADMFAEVSEAWQMELEQIRTQLQALHLADGKTMELGIGLLELATLARKRWSSMDRRQKRELLFTLRSNSRLCDDELKVTWRIPFNLLPESPYALERDEAVFSEENGPSSKWLPQLDSNQRHSD